ncbi:MAG: alpha-amylase family glycosyl hydrolase [Nannocystaceae bacterium]
MVEDCLRPRVVLEGDADERIARLDVRARCGAAITHLDVRVDGTAQPRAAVAPDDDAATLSLPTLPRGRHTLEVAAVDEDGRVGPAARSVVWTDPLAERLEDAIFYQVLVDRFRGDGGAPLLPPADPGARAGGTLDGVRAAIDSGWFEAMGVSTLWLSPVYLGPDDARPGRDDDHLYSGYHGYWPVDTRRVDPRLGGEAALRAVITAAHGRGLGVWLDLVPNHYDQTNPRVAAHDGEGWFNHREPPCICGASDCPWSTEIETCWFAPYLPDVRLQQPDALAAAIDDAGHWVDAFGIDGFRVDAVPMMPRAATRRIYHGVRTRGRTPAGPGFVGEVFTGAGAAGIAALRYHLGPDGLDSAFDFPTMWALRAVLAGEAGFDDLVASMQAQDQALAGSGSVLARMLGNHDTTRIATALAGQEHHDAWTDPAPAIASTDTFARLRLGFALLLTLPGTPVIYYGDELGLAGAADPDNRRVMPADDAVGDAATALRQDVARLGRLRRCAAVLRRGRWRSLGATADAIAFVRELDGEASVLVVASTATVATTRTVPAAVQPGWYKDAMSETRIEVTTAGATVELPPLGLVVLLPETHDCA